MKVYFVPHDAENRSHGLEQEEAKELELVCELVHEYGTLRQETNETVSFWYSIVFLS